MADDSSNDIVIYPPDSLCFALANLNPNDTFTDTVKAQNCTVQQSMVGFLNLTQDIEKYFAAYCVNPPKDDNCPFDFCPNPEVAGPLVRIANYVTAFCIAVLIFYSPRRVQEAFWSQILAIYSLLITAFVSIARRDLTRFHALLVLALVFSPITVYFIAYAIRSFWSAHHRLESLLGRTRYLRRSIVLLAGSMWLGLFIYAYLPKEYFFLIVPVVFMYIEITQIFPVLLFSLPILSMIAAWIIAIYLRRKEIWPPGEPYRPRFVKVWRTVGYYYPFIQFLTVVAFPMTYWICMVELCTLGTADNKFSLSFGQVFSVFIAVPPVIQVVQLIEEFWCWFRGLTWVRHIAGPPPNYHPKINSGPTGMPDLAKGKTATREELYSDN